MAEKKYLNNDGLSYLWLKLKEIFNNKVDKVSGKGLSDRNFTEDYERKLNSLENYVLPIASIETLGGVKIGAGLQINESGVLSATGGGVADSVAWSNITEKPTTLNGYGITDVSISGQQIILGSSSITIPSKTSELTNDSNFLTKVPVATSDVLGGIKVGANLSITPEGVLSASKVPTKVSELENDSGYLTTVPIASANTAGIVKVGKNLEISDEVLNVTGIPTKVSDLENDSNFQTESQVQSSINSAVGKIVSFDYQIVESLPDSGVKGTIYLVPTASKASDNIYDEYIWIEQAEGTGSFEFIGTTAVDLTGYLKEADLVPITNDEIDQILAS